MSWKINREHRCARCFMRKVLCLCSEIHPQQTRTRLVLLMHKREVKSHSNTGRLACLSLSNSELVLRGERGAPSSLGPFLNSERQGLLLYPSKDSLCLTSPQIQEIQKPITLFVPDGSWRQASKVCTREKELLHLPRVTLPFAGESRYRLRREPKKEGLATMEAIARAFGILEGPLVQAELERIFLLMVERVLWSRGKLSLAECADKIPPRAYQK